MKLTSVGIIAKRAASSRYVWLQSKHLVVSSFASYVEYVVLLRVNLRQNMRYGNINGSGGNKLDQLFTTLGNQMFWLKTSHDSE